MQTESGAEADDPDLLTGVPPLAYQTGAARGVSGDGSGKQSRNIGTDTGEVLVTGPAVWEDDGSATDPVSIMPPWKAVYIAKRTARTMLTVTS